MLDKSIILKPERLKSVVNKHPWIFSGAISKLVSNPKTGDQVSILDSNRNLLGYGHYVEDASLACKIFHFTSEPTVIDERFWLDKFQKALAYRRNINIINQSNGYRLFYAEADGLPGIICDIFNDTASLQINSAGMIPIESLIVGFLQSKLKIDHVYSKRWLLGKSESTAFVENGLKFEVSVDKGQKTGFFLDQRDNRQLVAQFAKNKTVLDAFCYSGGFSVSALNNGAKFVTSVDESRDAIELCKRNVASNSGNDGRHETAIADCFTYLREMSAEKYDLIVLDPPAFAKSASSVNQAAKGYKDINLLAFKKIRSNGLLFTFSCSQHISPDLFRKIVFGAAKDAGRSVRIAHQLTQAPDHPVNIFHPEGEYLKGLMLYVE